MKLEAVTSWHTLCLIAFESLHDKRDANSMNVETALLTTSSVDYFLDALYISGIAVAVVQDFCH